MDDLQSHYWQAIYDDGISVSETDGTPFNELDWDRVTTVSWFPKHESPLQVALIVTKSPGYRVFARMEGMLSMAVKGGKAGILVPCQKAYAFYLGLYADDGSEYAKEVERGNAQTVAKIDWMGGFKVFLPPDGKLQVVGSFEVTEDRQEINGKVVQFLAFNIKPFT